MKAETVKAINADKKKEYDQLKVQGVLGETPKSESEQAEPPTPRRELVDRLSLRYVGCSNSADLADIIDSRKKGNKVHVWPGCRKVSNRTDAPVLNIHRYNQRNEDRPTILFLTSMWCAECNPLNEILPSSMGRQCSELW